MSLVSCYGKRKFSGFRSCRINERKIYFHKSGQRREALFIFINFDAQRDFIRAFSRWKKQVAKPIPNYRYPNSQGPQDTHGRDKGLNPYDNPPIEDWSIETNKKGKKGNINCDSPVWKKKPICN